MDASASIVPPDASTAELRELSSNLGLVGFGVSRARFYNNVAHILAERDAAGLRDSMAFTYRNPARSCDPARELPGAHAVVSAALDYAQAGVGALAHSSVMARYARADYYALLRARPAALAKPLQERGYQARVVVDANSLVDKEPGVRSGAGWYLKNSLMAMPGHGSYLVLGEIITDAPLTPSAPRRRLIGCGTC